MKQLGMLCPTVGGGLGGLPERKSDVRIKSMKIKNTWTLYGNGNNTCTFDFSKVKNIDKLGFMFILPNQQGSSNHNVYTGSEIMPYIGSTTFEQFNISLQRYNTYNGAYIAIQPSQNRITLNAASLYGGTYWAVVITEYDFDYKVINITNDIVASGIHTLPVTNDITDISNVYVSHWCELTASDNYKQMTSGTTRLFNYSSNFSNVIYPICAVVGQLSNYSTNYQVEGLWAENFNTIKLFKQSSQLMQFLRIFEII